MDLPKIVQESDLYAKLRDDQDLFQIVVSLRDVTAKLAETISRTLPSFTDHSILHMDALWNITSKILTSGEISNMTSAEAFLLAAAFYLHDIGMAYAATSEGMDRIKASSAFTNMLVGMSHEQSQNPAVQVNAVAIAIRQTHSQAAIALTIDPVPGTEIYLIEAKAVREAWGTTLGRLAASHNWNLERVDQELGAPGVVPLPGGRKGDLGFVACILRLVDFAHINRDRASRLDRAFRRYVEKNSLVHWLAQENIDGPERDGSEITYRSSSPISDVDAWWLYYEMLSGLDAEIRAVWRYLEHRTASRGRLSVQGVRGSGSPDAAAAFIPPAGFLPIAVNLRTGSIDRLVKLLAGESLYGHDPMAAVRELIQNARDAVMLKATLASTPIEKASLKIPIRIVLSDGEKKVLEVTDWGVGMSRQVITDYLLSIASDYWTSQFYVDFPDAVSRGFIPAGKFGIGFLSVFMLGEEVTVESNREGSERLQLRLHGIERRGELRSIQQPSGSGTSVKVHLTGDIFPSTESFEQSIRSYAPMIQHNLQVEAHGKQFEIEVDWWRKMSTVEFHKWVLSAVRLMYKNHDMPERYLGAELYWRRLYRPTAKGIPWVNEWPEHIEDSARLVASFEGISLLCLRGLALQPVPTPGFVGLIDSHSAVPDISRRRALNVETDEVLSRACDSITNKLVQNLDALASKGFVVDHLDFISDCVRFYGNKAILQSSLPWICVLKMPGELELMSSTDFLTHITQHTSVYIAYNSGPWTAIRHWDNSDPPKDGVETAVVLDSGHDVTPHYYTSAQEEKAGNLKELWPEYERSALLGVILGIVSEAWQVSVESMTEIDTWTVHQSSIYGRVRRDR